MGGHDSDSTVTVVGPGYFSSIRRGFPWSSFDLFRSICFFVFALSPCTFPFISFFSFFIYYNCVLYLHYLIFLKFIPFYLYLSVFLCFLFFLFSLLGSTPMCFLFFLFSHFQINIPEGKLDINSYQPFRVLNTRPTVSDVARSNSSKCVQRARKRQRVNIISSIHLYGRYEITYRYVICQYLTLDRGRSF